MPRVALRPSARLAIDRVFSVKGRGTVVTGTLRDGCGGARLGAGRGNRAASASACARSRSMAGPSSVPKVAGPRSCWAPSMWRICIADRCSPVRDVGPSRRGSSSRFGPESTSRPACAASRPRTARDSSCISAPSRSARSSCARRESRSIDRIATPWRSSGSTGRSPRESPTGSPCAMHRRAGHRAVSCSGRTRRAASLGDARPRPGSMRSWTRPSGSTHWASPSRRPRGSSWPA